MRRYPCLVALLTAAMLAFVPGGGAWAADPASPVPEAAPAVGEVCDLADRPFDPEDVHLTGAWDDGQGGAWYLRQQGDRVALNGLSGRDGPPGALGRDWDVVGIGTFADDLSIDLELFAVPRGWGLDSGTATWRVGADADGHLQIVTVRQDGPFSVMTLRPCEPATILVDDFAQPFEYRDAPGIGLIQPGHLEGPWGFVGEGITAWRINEASSMSCQIGKLGPKLEPGPAAFFDWLRSRSDLVVSEATETTVDGRPALSVDVSASPSARGCMDGQVRLSATDDVNMMLPSTDTLTRLIGLDLDGDTIVFELWGTDQEEWLPLAQRVLDTIHFVG